MIPTASIEPLQIVSGVVAVIVIAIITYNVARAMKGKLEIELQKNGFNSGEEIVGQVTLTAKKSLNMNRMYVSLIGHEIIERRDSDGNKKTRRNEIYRNEVNILEAQMVPAGTHEAFDFTISTPGASVTPASETAQKVADVVNTAATALNALGISNSHRRLEWKVEARADLPGVDIAKSQKVRVNLI